MPIINDITAIGVPGAYVVSENTYGAIPQAAVSFNDTYMLIYSNKAGAPVATPTLILSTADFNNVYGTSLSANSVQMYFDQRPGVGLYCINVLPRKSYTVTIPTITVGASYGITVDGATLSVVAATGDTQATLLAKLGDLINTQVPFNATLIGGTLRVNNTLTATSTANITLGTAVGAAAYPTAGDVLDTATRVFDGSRELGYIIAPEFFQSFTAATDHAALSNGLEAIAADLGNLMFVLADCSQGTATWTGGAGFVGAAQAERMSINSPRGRMAYYAPYLRNLAGTLVPPSPAVAGMAMRRYRQQGFRQPPAGADFPLLGISDLSYPVTDGVQNVLNPRGINCIRRMSGGFYCWGARTVSNNPYYRFIAASIILNVLERTLKLALDTLVFSSVDGLGIVFDRIKTTAVGICERLRLGGALYGASPDDAYLVVCDATNNPGVDLDNGRVTVDIYVKPSPTAEVIGIRMYRAALSTTLSAETPYKTDVNNADGRQAGSGTQQ